jgi:hypothetical protein
MGVALKLISVSKINNKTSYKYRHHATIPKTVARMTFEL